MARGEGATDLPAGQATQLALFRGGIYNKDIRLQEITMSSKTSASSAGAQFAMTTVFTSGNSQAVRLPKEFRFSSKQVSIEKRGDEIVLRERKLTLGELLKSLPVLAKEDADEWDRVMAGVGDQPAQERNWDDLFALNNKKINKKSAARPTQTAQKRKAARK
jgi:antitoxin VapB